MQFLTSLVFLVGVDCRSVEIHGFIKAVLSDPNRLALGLGLKLGLMLIRAAIV